MKSFGSLDRRALTIGLMLALIASHFSAAFAADADRGLDIAQRWCNSCHIVLQRDSGMDDGTAAPRFSTLSQVTQDSIAALLASGHASMDALSKLPRQDIGDIVAHIKRLKPEAP